MDSTDVENETAAHVYACLSRLGLDFLFEKSCRHLFLTWTPSQDPNKPLWTEATKRAVLEQLIMEKDFLEGNDKFWEDIAARYPGTDISRTLLHKPDENINDEAAAMEAFIDSSVAYMLDNNMEDMMPDAFGIPDEPLNMSDFDDELDKEIYGEDEVATRRAKLIAEEHEELEIVKKLGEQMASELTDKVGTKRGREDEGGSGVSMADGTSHQVKKLEGRSGGLPYRAR